MEYVLPGQQHLCLSDTKSLFNLPSQFQWKILNLNLKKKKNNLLVLEGWESNLLWHQIGDENLEGENTNIVTLLKTSISLPRPPDNSNEHREITLDTTSGMAESITNSQT